MVINKYIVSITLKISLKLSLSILFLLAITELLPGILNQLVSLFLFEVNSNNKV